MAQCGFDSVAVADSNSDPDQKEAEQDPMSGGQKDNPLASSDSN